MKRHDTGFSYPAGHIDGVYLNVQDIGLVARQGYDRWESLRHFVGDRGKELFLEE